MEGLQQYLQSRMTTGEYEREAHEEKYSYYLSERWLQDRSGEGNVGSEGRGRLVVAPCDRKERRVHQAIHFNCADFIYSFNHLRSCQLRRFRSSVLRVRKYFDSSTVPRLTP